MHPQEHGPGSIPFHHGDHGPHARRLFGHHDDGPDFHKKVSNIDPPYSQGRQHCHVLIHTKLPHWVTWSWSTTSACCMPLSMYMLTTYETSWNDLKSLRAASCSIVTVNILIITYYGMHPRSMALLPSPSTMITMPGAFLATMALTSTRRYQILTLLDLVNVNVTMYRYSIIMINSHKVGG